VSQRAVHIHATVSELVPTMLGKLRPLQGNVDRREDSSMPGRKCWVDASGGESLFCRKMRGALCRPAPTLTATSARTMPAAALRRSTGLPGVTVISMSNAIAN
jgi:hypothetical protein